MTAPSTWKFDDLFRKYCDLVHATAYGVTGSYEDAEDIVQIIQSLTTIWARRRRPTTDAEPPDLPSPPEEASQAEEQHRRLYAAIAKLKPRTPKS